MSRGPSWKQLVIVLGVIAAVVVVSPALGGPSVKTHDSLDRAKQVAHGAKKKKKKATPGPQGPAGPAGAAGSARAFASVLNTADFVAGKVKGFTSLTRPATGRYCLVPVAGIDPNTTIALTDVDFGNSASGNSVAEARQSGLDCPAGQFEVVTQSPPGTDSNSVGFGVMVP
jgi:hypothetical protein